MIPFRGVRSPVDALYGYHGGLHADPQQPRKREIPRHTSDEDFLLEHADEFDRESALGNSRKLTSFLDARSREVGDISISKVRENGGF